MRLKYGSTFHADNECEVIISSDLQTNDADQHYATKTTWTIRGLLHGANPTQADIKVAIANLEAMYAIQNQDLILFHNDGTTHSAHTMLSNQSLGGIRVVGLSYPEGRGSEYATYRTYQVVLEGFFPVVNDAILAWDEIITFSGGGPQTIHLPCLEGPPQKQLVFQQTPFRASQRGSVTGFRSRPWSAVPPPIWPDAEIRPARVITPHAGKRKGTGLHSFAIDWEYQFEDAGELVGNPHEWPG